MLNKQGPGKIDWCDKTWNPISGKCLHNCGYCYMHRFWLLHPDMAKHQLKGNYLADNMPKNPSKIFVGSSTDMWGSWVHDEWIDKVLNKVEKNPQHTFQFLTKNPERYGDYKSLPKNGWYGTTIDGTDKTISNLRYLVETVPDRLKFVSFEPLIEKPDIGSCHDFSKLGWVIIGADSSRGANKPPKKWADLLISWCRQDNIPVWVKDNYGYPEVIKEFPKQKHDENSLMSRIEESG